MSPFFEDGAGPWEEATPETKRKAAIARLASMVGLLPCEVMGVLRVLGFEHAAIEYELGDGSWDPHRQDAELHGTPWLTFDHPMALGFEFVGWFHDGWRFS